jgi:uncharacterized protein YceH (UPF0502 family)
MASYAAVEPDPVEIRVVACLVEKQRTTPDQYPLTLNSLRLACNQSTNRDPVVDYDDSTIRAALDRLRRRNWAGMATWSTSRTAKYKHLLDNALQLTPPQLSLMTVLMLRGPQTPGELRARTERMYQFESNDELELTLLELTERELIAPLPRRPGERGQRYAHLLAGDRDEQPGEGVPAATAEHAPPAGMPDYAPPAADGGLAERVEQLEAEVSALRAELQALRERLDA